ncbi:DUF512 domain-containing protein [Candidatus Sumerlaeota bacterium]|nr:DUF512 domain-containing protein [Candidatus Sumerlaeota bacterium]
MNDPCVILSVEKGSMADKAGIESGDVLLKIGKTPINDVIDLMFCASDPASSIQYIRNGVRNTAIIPSSERAHQLGVRIKDFKPRSCNNRCVFCFIHQLPSGLRSSLYFKDEDYRLSFLCGNYITATNLSEKDIRRIINRRLSPLYVSVHATNPSLRAKLLGNPGIPNILRLLRRFKRRAIRFHVQIVLMPQINDGEFLKETIADLEPLFPSLLSIAIVPVGLTDHRRKLPRLLAVTPEYALKFIALMKKEQNRLRSLYGENFLFLSDEFYLLAEKRPPSYSRYEEIPQLENGIGMVAEFYRGFSRASSRLPLKVNPSRKIALVTASLGKKALRRFVIRMNKIKGLDLYILTVPNKLLGAGVTVSGLMAGRDIVHAIKTHPNFDLYILPENCLNPDGVLLDDLTPSDIQKQTGRRIFVASGRASDLIPYVVGKKEVARIL